MEMMINPNALKGIISGGTEEQRNRIKNALKLLERDFLIPQIQVFTVKPPENVLCNTKKADK